MSFMRKIVHHFNTADSGVRKDFRRRLLCLALSAVMLTGLLPGTALAASDGTDTASADKTAAASEPAGKSAVQVSEAGQKMDNTYALSVSTGSSSGKDVQFFAVLYLDENGTERTQYILPNGGDYQQSCLQAYKAGTVLAKRISTVKSMSGDNAADIIPESGKFGTPLSPYSMDTYLFTPSSPIQSVEEIQAFCASDTANGNLQWSCQSMRVYQVTSLYGLEMYGFYSDSCFVSFAGNLLAEADYNQTFSSRTDDILRFSSDSGSAEKLVTSFGDAGTAYDSNTGGSYFFEIAFEDTYGAGIEALDNNSGDSAVHTSLKNMGICEAMAMTVYYTDRFGNQRRAVLPVITSATAWAVEQGLTGDENLIGIAQQGESVGFTGYLPDCKTIDSYSLDYGNAASVQASGIQQDVSSSRSYARMSQLNKSDDILLRHVAIYDAGKTPITCSADGNTLLSQADGEPIRYYGQGEEKMSVGGNTFHKLLDYKQGALSADRSDQYLVQIQTDTVSLATSTADMTLKLAYSTAAGTAMETSSYDLRQYVKNYVGYWVGKGSDIAYLSGISAGGTLQFTISLSDVDHFTGASFTMTSLTGGWQMKSISVSKLSSLGRRMVSWDPLTVGSLSTDRTIYRNTTIEKNMLYSETPLLLSGGETKNIEVSSSGTGSTSNTTQEVNWSDMRFSMSYEQTMQNLGFTKSRYNYLVTVSVADDGVQTSENGDSGSKNMFYFQLVFQNGCSSYVLANQQLSSDGFRSGYDESFTISTNQYFGDVVSINVIPDDFSGDDSAFDKLKVDSISVQQTSDGALNKQWLAGDVGWISINYQGESGNTSVRAQAGRSEAELAKSYLITSSSYVVNLLFSLTTSADKANETSEPQFTGLVWATLTYYTNTGERRTFTFDVVKAMYEYDEKTVQYSADGSSGGAISDSAYMFRKGKTDRFIVSLADAKELVSMRLDATSQASTKWKIASLSAQLITSSGALRINSANEYERSSDTKVLTKQTSEKEPAYSAVCDVGVRTPIAIDFQSGNTIDVNDIDGSNNWSVSVSREPTTSNDVFNLFVFPSAGGVPTSSYDLKASVNYTDIYAGANEAASGVMNRSADGSMFYAIGISAKGAAKSTDQESGAVSVIQKLVLQAYTHASASTSGDRSLESEIGTILNARTNTAFSDSANMDYAVVQQVRSGVIVGTYYFNFNGNSCTFGAEAEPSAGTITAGKQVLDIELGQNVQTTQLVPETHDIAVAIRYTLENDPTNTVYSSPYIYLTDQGHTSVSSGNTLSLTFNQFFVKNIVGVQMISGGRDFSLPVEAARIMTYRSGDQALCTGCYSFAEGAEVTYRGTTMQLTSTVSDQNGLSTNPTTLEAPNYCVTISSAEVPNVSSVVLIGVNSAPVVPKSTAGADTSASSPAGTGSTEAAASSPADTGSKDTAASSKSSAG